ncbi:MAG: hypothetical protein ACLTT1_01795 [[Clostridium] scindens]
MCREAEPTEEEAAMLSPAASRDQYEAEGVPGMQLLNRLPRGATIHEILSYIDSSANPGKM